MFKNADFMKKIYGILILAVLFSCCSRDRGNYDYTAVNTLAIEGIPDDTVALHGELLKLTPVFERSLDSVEAGLVYSWTLAGQEIATTRNLEYVIPNGLDVKKYDCCYTVTDTENGMKYFKEFNISVTSPFSWGYYFLCEEPDGSTVLSYFSTKEGTTECLHTTSVGDVAFGKKPKALLDEFGHISSLNDYFYTMYIITEEGENPVIVTNNGSFMPTALINNSCLMFDEESFQPEEGLIMMTGDICFVSNGKLHTYNSGLLYRAGKHDKEYYWSHMASVYTYIYVYDELSHKFYILKNQINDPAAGLISDPYAYDRVVEIEGQPSYEGQTIIYQTVTQEQKMYMAMAQEGHINLITLAYIDNQEETENEPARFEYGYVEGEVDLPLSEADENAKGVLVAENDWYFVAGNKVYTSPLLLPELKEFVTLPGGIGEVTAIAVSSKETSLIIATYDEGSTEEYKGSFVLLDLASKEMTVHKNVMGKCVVAKGYDANPWF